MIVKNISRILNVSRKTLSVLAPVILLSVCAAAQVPPSNQGLPPQLPKQRTLLLEVDLRINGGGAASTSNRAVTLDFTAREKTDGNLTVSDETAQVTHYRVLEDSTPENLSAESWLPITRRPPFFNLAERNKQGQRYGERRVVFQVKTAALTSNIVSVSLLVEPLLKEYRVSASGNTHPLLQYAAQQGFTFPLDYYETCKGSCVGKMGADLDLASGSASVSSDALVKVREDNSIICVITSVAMGGLLKCGPRSNAAPVAAGTCTTKADYHLFEGRELNRFWRIKSVNVTGATAHPHGANRFLVKLLIENKDATCLSRQISVGDIVVEGPVEDDFVDAANPWKNAFVRPSKSQLLPIATRPN